MSKKAKAACGYVAKPVHRTCGNCGSYTSDRVFPEWMRLAAVPGGEGVHVGWDVPRAFSIEQLPLSYSEEKNKRCSVGGFAVAKTATCSYWSAIEEKGAAA